MTSHDNVTDIELFADDVTGVQSRIVICHQLLASADIQDKQTKAETGWADTNDRAELMRKAADTIATLRKELEKSEAMQDLAYYNGAKQYAVMAGESEEAAQQWLLGGCGNRQQDAIRALKGQQ